MDNFREAIDEATKDLHGGPLGYGDAVQIVTDALYKILMSKDKKYGKSPIQKFGLHGIVIRASDKVDRLQNGIFNGTELGKEGVLDSFGDLAGYGILGVLKEMGWHDLPNGS